MKVFRLMSLLGLWSTFTWGGVLPSASAQVGAIEIPEDCQVGPLQIDESSSEQYVEAYIRGVVDTKFPEERVGVAVRNGEIILSNLPTNEEQAQKIVAYVNTLTKWSVRDDRPALIAYNDPQVDEVSIKPQEGWQGIWLPQSTVLFPTQIANPRQVCFSGSFRFHDRVGGRFASDVVLGAQFPIYRWAHVYDGDLQLEVEGAVFAVFDLRKSTFPLINADYYAGIPITYAKGPWSYRIRTYHISSHVGDEFLCEHHGFNRKNKSFEALDFSVDYQFNPYLRAFGIVGSVFLSDREMHMKPMYLQYGFEARGPRTDFTQLFAQPFLSVFLENAQDVHYHMNSSYALGYEWGKINGVGRKVRIFLEYHDGFSPEGQFCRKETKYFGIRFSYGF